MTKRDWSIASIVAVVVAGLTVALVSPPLAWAADAPPPVPALPSTELTITSIQAKVSAVATPAPGQPVKVILNLTCPAGTKTDPVPVTLTVSSTTSSMLTRTLPMPVQVAQVNTTIPVGADGKGTATIDLPLTWAASTATAGAPTAPMLDAVVTSYSMVLGSTLAGASAAPQIVAFVYQGQPVAQLNVTPNGGTVLNNAGVQNAVQ